MFRMINFMHHNLRNTKNKAGEEDQDGIKNKLVFVPPVSEFGQHAKKIAQRF